MLRGVSFCLARPLFLLAPETKTFHEPSLLRQVLECASPLALSEDSRSTKKSGRGPPQSKSFARSSPGHCLAVCPEIRDETFFLGQRLV